MNKFEQEKLAQSLLDEMYGCADNFGSRQGDSIQTRVCTDCDRRLPLNEFYRNGTYILSRCKRCHCRVTNEIKKKGPKALELDEKSILPFLWAPGTGIKIKESVCQK